MKTKRLALTGMLAAAYAAMVWGLAPLSFAIVQFRLANMLKALAICRPEFALAFAVGDFVANQASPFGMLDWLVMPFFDFMGAWLAWQLRRIRWLAVLVQSAIIAVGVATFPLGLGARLPWVVSFTSVFVSSVVLIGLGTAFLVPLFERAQEAVSL